MAKGDKPQLAEDQNVDGTNFDAKAMLKSNAEKSTKIKFKDRLKVELTKDTLYQKKGKVYSPHRVKAEALVEQGLAKFVK